jgi:hypothetical protein
MWQPTRGDLPFWECTVLSTVSEGHYTRDHGKTSHGRWRWYSSMLNPFRLLSHSPPAPPCVSTNPKRSPLVKATCYYRQLYGENKYATGRKYTEVCWRRESMRLFSFAWLHHVKKHHNKPGRTVQNNIKTDIKRTLYQNVDWFQLALNWISLRTVLITATE